MKQLKLKAKGRSDDSQDSFNINFEELRAQRRARLEMNRRIEALKVSLLRMTDKNMEHAVRLVRRWLAQSKK